MRSNATVVPKLNIDLKKEIEDSKANSYRRKDIILLRRKNEEPSSAKKGTNRSGTTSESKFNCKF